MIYHSAIIPTHDVDPAEGLEGVCKIDPSSAQIKLWHAQKQHDNGVLSSKELAVVERIAAQTAGRARTIYNPFTGEIRKAFLPDWIGKHKPDEPPVVGWRQEIL